VSLNSLDLAKGSTRGDIHKK